MLEEEVAEENETADTRKDGATCRLFTKLLTRHLLATFDIYSELWGLSWFMVITN